MFRLLANNCSFTNQMHILTRRKMTLLLWCWIHPSQQLPLLNFRRIQQLWPQRNQPQNDQPRNSQPQNGLPQKHHVRVLVHQEWWNKMSRQKPKLLIRELLVATPTHRPSLLDGEERSQVEFLSLFICLDLLLLRLDFDFSIRIWFFNLFNLKGGNISPFLLKANVTVLDNSVCTRQYNTSFILTIMMCASAPGKDTCQVSLKKIKFTIFYEHVF